ncbi:hypothetical protein [Niabella aquatica]
MRIILLIAFACFNAVVCKAQDSIFLRDKTIIPARILEINERSVIYKKTGNPSGPDYKVSVNRVKHIIFESGAVEEFSRRAPHPPAPVKPDFSRRVEAIIRNKKLYPHTLPDNLLSAGYFTGQNVYYGAPDDKLAHGLYIKYQRLLFNEVVGLGIAPFIAFNQKQVGAKFTATAYTKFFGKLRIGAGPYYSISHQGFTRYYWVKGTMPGSRIGWVYMNDDKATVGSVGLSAVAMLHLNTSYLLSFGADIGGAAHINKYKTLPESWEQQPVGHNVTIGQLSLGITRRF